MRNKTIRRKAIIRRKRRLLMRVARRKKMMTVRKRRRIARVLKFRRNRKKRKVLNRKKRIRPVSKEQPHEGNTRVIVYIPFNNLNVRENLPSWISDFTLPDANTQFTKEWINKRVAIFMKFTLKSLLNQTNPHYLAYIVYHDSSRAYIDQALFRYPPLPSNIRFISASEYESTVISQLYGYKYWYELHLYSDDMYHKSYIDMLYNYKPKPKTKVLICQNGYIYNSISDVLAKYFNFSSSFNCLIYKVSDYRKGVRHNIFQPSETGIWTGAIQLPHEIIHHPVYINHSHDANTAFFFAQEIQNNAVYDVWTNNTGHYALFGEIIYDPHIKQRILKDFIGN